MTTTAPIKRKMSNVLGACISPPLLTVDQLVAILANTLDAVYGEYPLTIEHIKLLIDNQKLVLVRYQGKSWQEQTVLIKISGNDPVTGKPILPIIFHSNLKRMVGFPDALSRVCQGLYTAKFVVGSS